MKLHLCKCGATPEVVSTPSKHHAYTEREVKCLACGHHIYRHYSTGDAAVAIREWNEGHELEDARKASGDGLLFDLEHSGKRVQKALARIIRAVEAV